MGTHPIFESDFDCLTEMSGLPRPALGGGANGQRSQLNESSSNNISDTSNLSEASANSNVAGSTPKSRQRIQNDTSLGATAKRFVSLMTGACDQTIELNDAAKRLNAPKRRIYDVTNVLEGIGLVAKKEKNRFEWVGGDVDSTGQVEPDEAELQSLRQWEKELSQAIEQQERQLRYMTENSDGLGYVTCGDIRSIFNNKMVLCIKAPPDTKLQIPEPAESGIQMLLKSTRGPIECYLCPEADPPVAATTQQTDKSLDKSSSSSTQDNNRPESTPKTASKFLPFSPISEQDYLFTLGQNEGIQELFDIN